MLTFLKLTGLDTEIESDFYKLYINIHIAAKNDKLLDETRKALFKLYYPDMEDGSQKLMKETQSRLLNDKNPIMRIGTDGSQKIDPIAANHLLNKS